MAGGFVSPFAFWVGGAGGTAVTTQAGYRSTYGIWTGGVSAVPGVTQAGYRSVCALWIGGASAIISEVPETPTIPGPSGGFGIDRRYYDQFIKKHRDDDDILDILMSISHIL